MRSFPPTVKMRTTRHIRSGFHTAIHRKPPNTNILTNGFFMKHFRYAIALLWFFSNSPAFAQAISYQGIYSSVVTVGTTSVQVVPAFAAKQILDLTNNSGTAAISCNFGSPATGVTWDPVQHVAVSSDTLIIVPYWHKSWDHVVPADAINCIASAASTPMSVGVK